MTGRKGHTMKYANDKGQAVYFNSVNKGFGTRWIVKAVSGQVLLGRDGQKLKSRTFRWSHQAEAFLKRNGYTTVLY